MLDNAALHNDGSIDAALQTMPDIEALEAANPDLQQQPEPTRTNDTIRGDDGRFKAREADAKEVEAKAPDKAAETEDDDDPFVEFPAEEEGKEPIRAKLSDVWNGYTKAQQLEKELETAKTSQRTLLPHEVETVVSQVNNERQRVIAQLEQLQRLQQPAPPNMALINPGHPEYNPEEFYRQTQAFQNARMRQSEIAAQIEAQQDASRKEQEALLVNRAQREWAEVQKVWPEYTQSKDAAEKYRSELKANYGFDDATLNSVMDHRFFALAKDALASRQAKAKEAEAVKIVKAKPKLVSGIARQASTGQQRASQDGLKRLQVSGSLEDAASALDGLF